MFKKVFRALVFLMLFTQLLIAQNITGKVTDAGGTPLIGVSVLVAGTSTGTVTEIDGSYSISASQGEQLQFSYIGMLPQAITVGGESVINITMQASETSLAEVVVIGYGTIKKENLTGAVDQISVADIENRPINNVGRGLQGLIPNLNIVFTDGTPGATPQFNVRGVTSINGGDPLILIDGIPADPELVTLLNPNDIESVTVLKDAASAAIYGARGGFGVILIKTKTGTTSKPQVNYSTFVGINTPTILPEPVTDTYTSMLLFHEARKAWDNTLVYTEDQLEYARQRSADPSLPNFRIANDGRYEYYGNVDWFDEMYEEQQPMMQHNLSFSGSTGNLNYYLSGSYLFQDGIYEYDADQFERFNFRSKLDFAVNDWLSIRNNTFYNNGNYDYRTLDGGSVTTERWIAILGNAQNLPLNPDGTWTFPGGLSLSFLRDGGPGSNVTQILQNTTGFEASFFEDSWKINGDYTFQVDGSDINEFYIQQPYRRYELNPDAEFLRGVSRVLNTTTDNRYHVFNLYTSYEKQFGRHFFRGMVGFNQELRTFSSVTARRDDVVSNLGSINLAVGEAQVDGSASEWAVRGVFYRLNYNFDGKYLFEFNGRYDGTSRFPQDNRFGFFPSASAGWRISEEGFFEGLKPVVSDLKLRASYGALGNQQVGTYAYIPSMTTFNTTTVVGGEQPLATSAPGLVSPDLTWERVTTLDFGIDFSLFNYRLATSFDWYQRETTGMLTKGRTLPAVLGTEEPLENAADLRTIGWEVSIDWNDRVNLFGKTLSYNLGVVASDFTAEITRFDNPNNFLGDFYEGQNFGDIWGYETLGFFQSEEEIAEAPDHSELMRRPASIAPGDLRFADLNGDGVINQGEFTLENPGDLKIVGNSLIRWSYGLRGGVNWNGFSLSAFFQGVGKHDFLPGRDDAFMWSVFNRPNNVVLSHIVDNYWTPENRDAYFPRLVGFTALGAGKQLAAPQSRYIQDASYIRLKNLTFGYTLPQTITRRAGIERVNIYFSGENLWENTNMIMPVDPELLNVPGQVWGDGQNYPYQRSYSIGLNVTF